MFFIFIFILLCLCKEKEVVFLTGTVPVGRGRALCKQDPPCREYSENCCDIFSKKGPTGPTCLEFQR